ncbi:MAG: hypothetical protein U0838_08010 [Chloroflexota bacterium]
MAAVIPERTIDYWLSVEIIQHISSALIWGPGQPQQRVGRSVSDLLNGRPYDLAASVPHVFALEAKALYGPGRGSRWGVWLDEDQHWAMLVLEAYHKELAWYALPAPDLGLVTRRMSTFAGINQIPDVARLRALDDRFGRWMRVIRPSVLTPLLGFSPTYPSISIPPTAVRGVAGKKSRGKWLDFADYAALGDELGDFLDEVKACRVGPSMARLREIISGNVHDRPDLLRAGRLAWVAMLADQVGQPAP